MFSRLLSRHVRGDSKHWRSHVAYEGRCIRNTARSLAIQKPKNRNSEPGCGDTPINAGQATRFQRYRPESPSRYSQRVAEALFLSHPKRTGSCSRPIPVHPRQALDPTRTDVASKGRVSVKKIRRTFRGRSRAVARLNEYREPARRSEGHQGSSRFATRCSRLSLPWLSTAANRSRRSCF
jgi:hypothetical protein